MAVSGFDLARFWGFGFHNLYGTSNLLLSDLYGALDELESALPVDSECHEHQFGHSGGDCEPT